jgi:hypothetical protein
MNSGSIDRKGGGQMKIWKKVLVASVSALTLGAGVGAAVASSGSSPSRGDRVAQVGSASREGEIRHGLEPGNDRGRREAEARGHEAENEQEQEANEQERQGDQHQQDRSGRDGRGTDDRGMDA